MGAGIVTHTPLRCLAHQRPPIFVRVIGTASTVCGAGYMQRSGVCPSVCLSHHLTAATSRGGFAAERRAAEDIGRLQYGRRRAPSSNGAAARSRSTALSSKCGQCHVDSRVDEAEHRLVNISFIHAQLIFFWITLLTEFFYLNNKSTAVSFYM